MTIEYEPLLNISEVYLAAWSNMDFKQLYELRELLLDKLERTPQQSTSVIIGYREMIEQLENYIETRKVREDDKNNRTRRS